ncbi:thioredoxin family protein [Pseudocolwellia agarivorans]|uniref:thioredoxin family protein n=1 Tax=Pseudocolwellia agarivorans TaxID=1911682 RepID=UPI0009850151|nr:thioredoxin family protein [Pseudocolwellia agarivorans]
MLAFKSISKIIVLIGFILLASCTSGTSTSGNTMSGIITKDNLLASETSFNQSYQAFLISEKDKLQVNGWPRDLHIDIYFGAWCHDSQREVPKILSILDNNPNVTFQLIALDIEKKDPEHLAKKNNIKYTPTFVVFLAGKEIGRIVERPTQSIINDITAMYFNSLKVID